MCDAMCSEGEAGVALGGGTEAHEQCLDLLKQNGQNDKRQGCALQRQFKQKLSDTVLPCRQWSSISADRHE